MSKKLLCILGILATILVGAILYWKYVCDCAGGSSSELTADKSVVAIPDKNPAPAAPVPDSSATLRLVEEKANLNADPLIFYFSPGSNTVDADNGQRAKIEKLAGYLKNAGNAVIEITGHTDNTGPYGVNMKLGLERALSAKDHLVRSGIQESVIITTSRGPDDPMAGNDSPEGRAKNRRAVIMIK
ncbi:MAG TPA: OmpA family protein [Bacteroidales bacterium]|jgi:outer membrane protein OmpA-like peptidoglycan-associated protein|nr:OmpA family protein [Bacteroidales bacterium]